MAEAVASKFGMMMHHHKLESRARKLVFYLQCHGYNQNMTVAIIFIELLNQVKCKQNGHNNSNNEILIKLELLVYTSAPHTVKSKTTTLKKRGKG